MRKLHSSFFVDALVLREEGGEKSDDKEQDISEQGGDIDFFHDRLQLLC